jgi:hypothetical protein
MTDIKNFSSVAASNNLSPPDGFPEGQAASTYNNSARELMAAIRRQHEQAEWIDFGDVPTYISTTSFSVPNNRTSFYQVGRRIRISDSSTLYGTITASVFTSLTTVTVALDSGSISVSISAVAAGLLSVTNPSFAVSTANIANNAVTTAKIADGAVTPIKLSQLAAYSINANNTNATADQTTVGLQNLYPQSFQIGATVAANALTATLQPTPITFRSSSLGSGSITNLMVTTALSLTVASGATLGTTNGTAANLFLAAINVSGTVEYAIINLTGIGSFASEGIASTTALSASSNAGGVWYSTTARTNVPYKLVGIITSTQATAGTWATAPSAVQGYGIGQQGQTVVTQQVFLPPPSSVWSNPARTSGTNYTNTSAYYKPVYVNLNATTGSTVVVGGVTIHNNTNGQFISVAFLVPPNVVYTVTAASGINSWAELG